MTKTTISNDRMNRSLIPSIRKLPAYFATKPAPSTGLELIPSENLVSEPSSKLWARSSRTSTPRAIQQALLRRLRIRGQG